LEVVLDTVGAKIGRLVVLECAELALVVLGSCMGSVGVMVGKGADAQVVVVVRMSCPVDEAQALM